MRRQFPSRCYTPSRSRQFRGIVEISARCQPAFSCARRAPRPPANHVGIRSPSVPTGTAPDQFLVRVHVLLGQVSSSARFSRVLNILHCEPLFVARRLAPTLWTPVALQHNHSYRDHHACVLATPYFEPP